MRLSPPALVLALAVTTLNVAHAQPESLTIHVAIGWGVDTVSSPNHEIFALWRAYLGSHPESLRKTPHWSSAEQAKWLDFDLLRMVYQGPPKITVIQLAPAPGLDSTYVIRNLFAVVVDSTHDVKPIAFYRVYATREGGRWVLGNALPRMTRRWKHETIGHVTFVYPPTHAFDRASAQGSARFVDSLARAFNVPVPIGISYYVADNADDVLRARGLDFFPTVGDTVYGQTLTGDNIVFTAGVGERHRHELSHIVLLPLMVAGRTNRLVAEGLATWVGGSEGLPFPELVPGLRRYVESHPDLTIQSVLSDPPAREGSLDVGYDGLAVLCKMVYDKGGVPAIRELAAAGVAPDSVLSAAALLLGIQPSDLDAAWRHSIHIWSR